MPTRVRRVAAPLYNRLLYHAVMAVVVGVSGNVFVHFTFKIDVDDIPRFALQNMIEYGMLVGQMLLNPRRLQVGLSAVLLYAVFMSLPIHWLKHSCIAPCFQFAGIDNPDISWRRLMIRLPYRIAYWLLSALERMLVAWLVYITYLAHNPATPLSWLKYMQNVKSPIRILSNPDNLIGFVVFLLSISFLASVFSLMVRRQHRQLGLRGGVLKNL